MPAFSAGKRNVNQLVRSKKLERYVQKGTSVSLKISIEPSAPVPLNVPENENPMASWKLRRRTSCAKIMH